jgi:ribosomal protein S12 methylthiotransferase
LADRNDLPKDIQEAAKQSLSVGMVSLGCAKNLVDSEIMLASLKTVGYDVTPVAEEAEVIIVNTCGFIGTAKEESINTILEMASYKESGRCQTLVVTGCLGQRYGQELMEEMPEIDGLLGTGQIDRLPELLQAIFRGQRPIVVGPPGFDYNDSLSRLVSTPPHSVYLKIAEGCSHTCAYCVIPMLRGPYRSRPMASIIKEAQELAEQGAKELVLIAQDTSAYGKDLPGNPGLHQLLEELSKIPKVHWLRVLYTYPTTFSTRLIEEFAQNPKVCHYVDLPLQHASNDVLVRMGRGPVAKAQRRLIKRLRQAMPDVAIRSSFIVGFPGETEAEFQELLDFLEEVRFDHVGVFAYSLEEGSAAAELAGQIPEPVKQERRRQAMLLQQKITEEKLKAQVGKVYEVLIDGPSEETDLVLVARSEYQAPSVDGLIYIGNRWLGAGELAMARITESHTYDLVAEILDESGEKPCGH